jgi:urease accessory protein
VPLAQPLATAAAADGWAAELDLVFAARGDRTVLVRRRHFGPLRVQRPFYPEREVCHVYLVHPPGGVVGGDRLDTCIAVQPGASALLTTPAAGKFYRSGGDRVAVQHTALSAEDACLEWLPQETLFYRGARVRMTTSVALTGHPRFIGWELACFGLPARCEPFSDGQIRQHLEVSLDGQPLLCDRLRLDAADRGGAARWGLDGHALLGTMLAYPMDGAGLALLREALPATDDGTRLALSVVDGLLVCRALGQHADAVMQAFIAAWKVLRPRLMQREALPPRIWST